MKGIILAAGQGTRLRPLTYAVPKPLFPVGRKPMVEFAIKNISPVVDEIYVAVSHKKELIKEYFDKTSEGRTTPVKVVDAQCLETAGDLALALDAAGRDDDVIVAYADSLIEFDAYAFLDFHKSRGAKASMLFCEVPQEEVHRFGIALFEGDVVSSFVEKPEHDVGSRWANAGYYILSKDLLGKVPREKIKMEQSLFPELVKRGELYGFRDENIPYYIDMGTWDAYVRASALICNQELSSSERSNLSK